MVSILTVDKVSVTDELDSGVFDQTPKVGAAQELKLSLALVSKTSRCLREIGVGITGMAHHFVNTRAQTINDIRKRFQIEKARFCDSEKPVRCNDRWFQQEPDSSGGFRKDILLQ